MCINVQGEILKWNSLLNSTHVHMRVQIYKEKFSKGNSLFNLNIYIYIYLYMYTCVRRNSEKAICYIIWLIYVWMYEAILSTGKLLFNLKNKNLLCSELSVQKSPIRTLCSKLYVVNCLLRSAFSKGPYTYMMCV